VVAKAETGQKRTVLERGDFEKVSPWASISLH